VPLEGWFIPAAGPGKLIIANHQMVVNGRKEAYPGAPKAGAGRRVALG
jgi:hypothetical protein